jgi:hypothetical protein
MWEPSRSCPIGELWRTWREPQLSTSGTCGTPTTEFTPPSTCPHDCLEQRVPGGPLHRQPKVPRHELMRQLLHLRPLQHTSSHRHSTLCAAVISHWARIQIREDSGNRNTAPLRTPSRDSVHSTAALRASVAYHPVAHTSTKIRASQHARPTIPGPARALARTDGRRSWLPWLAAQGAHGERGVSVLSLPPKG